MTRQLAGSGTLGLWIAAIFAVIPWLIVTLEIFS